ncbi:hypothetical protein D3C85_1583380 [compost metagenome]
MVERPEQSFDAFDRCVGVRDSKRGVDDSMVEQLAHHQVSADLQGAVDRWGVDTAALI